MTNWNLRVPPPRQRVHRRYHQPKPESLLRLSLGGFLLVAFILAWMFFGEAIKQWMGN